MAILRYIRADLRRVLMLVPGLPVVAWEGRPYKPVAQTPYILENLDPITSGPATFGIDGKTEERMMYSLDLYWPTGEAGFFISDGEDMADAIREMFYSGREIASSGAVHMSGSVLSSERRPALSHAVFIQLPIRITFFVRRPTKMP